MLFSGLLDLPGWGYVLAALALTHVTIAAVTIYLHRCQAHRALELHPLISHFFRFWLWLTTRMVTKEWAAIHRSHRAKCETVASTNIVPCGILIGGEELHNNHHAFASSAKLSSKWYEIDVGWMYICVLQALGLATVKKLAPKPRFARPKAAADLETLHAVISNRYDVLSRYAKSVRRTYAEEIERLKHWSPGDAEVLHSLRRALLRGQALAGAERARLAEVLKKSRALATVVAMRHELVALWERSSASKEQLLRQLQDWCHRAEASGIASLVDFSQRLRSYA